MKKLLITALFSFILVSTAVAEQRFVRKVIDGRTLQLLNGETVRLIGIDESNEKATKFISGLVSGTVIDLEFDNKEMDQEGNILAYVWFEYPYIGFIDNMDLIDDFEISYKVDTVGSNGFYVFLNATAIKSGHAKPSSISVNTKHAQLFEKIYKDRISRNQFALAEAVINP